MILLIVGTNRANAMKESRREYESGMSDLEAAWHQIKQRYKECNKTLLKIAKMSCRKGHEDEAINLNQPIGIIEPAISAGLVKVENGKVRFKDERVWLYAVCEYLVCNVLMRAWEDDKKLWGVMRAIYLRGYRIKYDALAANAVEVLHNRHGMDVIKRVGELCKKGEDFWNVLHAFAEALPKLKVEVASLRETLSAIEKVIRNDLAGMEIYDAVEKLSELQSYTGEALYRELVAEKKGAITGFIPCVLLGLGTIDFGKAYTKATILLESDSADLIGAGIIAMGSMDYHENSKKEYLHSTLENYKKLKRRRKVQVIASLVKSYGRLLKYTDESKRAIVQLSNRKTPEVLYEVAIALSLNAKKCAGEQWFREALMNFSDVSSEYAGILQRIDGVLSHIAGEKKCDLVTFFWEAWVVKRDYEKSDQERLGVYKQSLSRMSRECLGSLMRCITNWLNSDEHRLHLAAAELVRELCHRRKQVNGIEFKLDREALEKMGARDIVYVIYKILGYASVNPGALCDMVFSALEPGSQDQIVTEYVVAAFRDYIAYNYPGTTIDFLRKRKNSKNTTEAETASRILKEVEAYYERLKDLPQLVEFEPLPQRAQQLVQTKSRHYGRQIYEGVREHSVFLQFCKEIHLKAGSSFVMEQDGKFTGKTKLGHVSHSMEFARGELIDPVGQALLRLRWRNLNREDVL